MHKRLLFVPGWCHSNRRYYEIKKLLECDFDVDLFEFGGFGECDYGSILKNPNPLKKYEKDLEKKLKSEKYDMVYAHSMGALLMLKVLSKNYISIDKVILSNTPYNVSGLRCIRYLLYPLFVATYLLPRLLPEKYNYRIYKTAALATIKKSKHFDEITYKDIIKANPVTTPVSLVQLFTDKTVINPEINKRNNLFVFYSENDLVIPKYSTRNLIDIVKPKGVHLFKGIGHTPFLESRDEFIEVLKSVSKC